MLSRDRALSRSYFVLRTSYFLSALSTQHSSLVRGDGAEQDLVHEVVDALGDAHHLGDVARLRHRRHLERGAPEGAAEVEERLHRLAAAKLDLQPVAQRQMASIQRLAQRLAEAAPVESASLTTSRDPAPAPDGPARQLGFKSR